MTLSQILLFASNPTIRVMLLTPLALILLDWVLGVARAARQGVFRTAQLGDFAHSNLLPYATIVLTFLAALLAGTPIEAAFPVATVAMTGFCASQAASIVENVAILTSLPQTTVEGIIAGILHRTTPQIEAAAYAVEPTPTASTEPQAPAAKETPAA